jgi:hypothetical protein
LYLPSFENEEEVALLFMLPVEIDEQQGDRPVELSVASRRVA